MDTIPTDSLAVQFRALAAGLELVASAIELFAILVLLNGILRFVPTYLGAEFRTEDAEARGAGLNAGRVDLSRYILAALEVFIVSDIIRTVLTPTLQSLAVLGALVVIRSIISLFLGREIGGLEQTRRQS